MRTSTIAAAILLSCTLCFVGGQRITTIQLEGVQYFVSRMNPYSPALNYFLAYQYCRSLGLQLASFETKEKADSITQYLINAGYNDYDFWTSGNRLGRDMFLWMSTGLPFNVTFNYMREIDDSEVPPTLIGSGPVGEPGEEVHRPVEEHQYVEGKSRGRQLSAKSEGACVALSAPDLKWDVDECSAVKDFICEQTRCYYYNYGSIPVSASQGANRRTAATTTPAPPTTPPPPTTTTTATTTTTTSATTQEPEEVLTTTTAKASSSPSFKVNRRITLRPVHFPNLGSLLASPWSSSLAPSPVYHHGKSGKVEKAAENAPSTVLDTSSSQPTKPEEATSRPEVETTPMNQNDTPFPLGRKDTIDWSEIGFKTTEIQT